ncbi:cytokinesis regulator [Stachybotrys elegans]|uniref:Cytokinesis regulator n=1 Tax=Stachybotrys elegans TaxID=80388 RepID=A0A8K0SZT0_9HYPO|nr:cytokinesis regulator [Stachybotrys elegans]
MEPLRLKPRQPVVDEVENWDDDDFVIEGDDLTFRSGSTGANAAPRRRDSNSSHRSRRSDLESWNGEEKQVHIPDDDEKSTLDAIAAAQHAGIPLPKNVPSSALMGGTIKRLGGRKIRKIIQDDWENDIELPDLGQALKIKPRNNQAFPETLRQVSGGSPHSSPVKATRPAVAQEHRRASLQSVNTVVSAAVNLDKFKDADDDDDIFGDGMGTFKVSKSRNPLQPVSLITPPTPQKAPEPEDDFEKDLELPSDGKLKLSTKRDIPKTPSSQSDDLDWGEGSLGTRYGGTRRDGRSNRSSSASALSPSVSSSITAESEDETFEGLVLPVGPLNFQDRLMKRRKSRSPERIVEEPEPEPQAKISPQAEKEQQDFLDGLDLGEGDVFDSGKLTLHRNIKLRDARPASPARPKTAVALTFTNKPSVHTRIPRLSHERTHSTPLEPVSESGAPILQRSNRRPQSRLGHSAQSSVSSIPTPSSPPSVQNPSTPRRREVTGKNSMTSLRAAPTTTSAQLLKQKRSLPAIRALPSPAKQPMYRNERPGSRSDANRPSSSLRPKTPVERHSPGASDGFKKGQVPFLAGGSSMSQSHHSSTKSLRAFRRHDSDNSIDLRPKSRATTSRSGTRSPSPQRYRVAADTWERLSKPKNKKHFGDGHELDAFDDLPTSRETETRYLKQPITSGPKSALRNKAYQNVMPDRNSTPSPSTPRSPAPRMMHTPRFARDTAASRIARETSLAHRASNSVPLAPVATHRLSQLSARSNLSPQPHSPQSPAVVASKSRSKKPRQLKPHLISNLSGNKESKMVNGMFYNADTFKWEGNENALNAFEPPMTTPTATANPSHLLPAKEVTTPRPALITNISATKGVQVVGGMVFDPQNMCWLKIGQPTKAVSETSDPLDGFDALEDEDDVFKDIPDLEEPGGDEDGNGRVSDIKDEWLVGEEFDVGPEFIRRQREEEDRWRKKCEKWSNRGPRDREAWRWTIRELVSQFGGLAM